MKKVLFLFLLYVFTSTTFGQGNKMQALYIYNFTKLIEWPDSHESKNMVIGVYGSRESFNEINNLLKGKQVGSKDFKIVLYNSANDIADCHVLFLPDTQFEILQALIPRLKNKPILIITDKPGMIERGSGINFKIVDGKQSYEISKTNIKIHNLEVSNQLLNLGISR